MNEERLKTARTRNKDQSRMKMLQIKVLGPGCRNCHLLEQMATAGLEELLDEYLDLEATLEHIDNPTEFQKYPILFTPGLVVNEKLVCAGRIPNKEEVIRWYRAALDHVG